MCNRFCCRTLLSTLALGLVVMAVATLGTAQDVGPAPGAKKDIVDEKLIRSLIADLGHDSFDRRQAAYTRLLGIGGPAVDLLKKAASASTDVEVRERASRLVEEIQELQLLGFRAEFYQDFRKVSVPTKAFRLYGPNVANLVKSEPEGLRITLADEKNADAIGIAMEHKIKGDFEITAGYEIIKAPVPQKGDRAGFEIYLATDTAGKEALAFDRAIVLDGREVYMCSRMTNKDGRRQNVYQGDNVLAKGKLGQLRIVRVGTKVALSVQEGEADSFRVVHRTDLGKEDIKLVRLAANPGRSTNSVDLRIRDVRIRSGEVDAFKVFGR